MVSPSRSIFVVPRTSCGDVGDEPLELLGDVVVVGVGLVPLEHRELGVVLVRDPLVAEVLAELVDLVDSANHQALQVELGRDPQVEVAVERVVVGDEWPGERAPVERLEHGRLHLHEAARVEPAAHRGDRPGPGEEELAGLLVRHQVELAAAVAGLDVLEAVELLRRRAQGLREQLPGLGPDRELAAPGCEHGPLDADDVPDVQREQALVGIAELIDARLDLDLAGAVAQVEEGGLAVLALRDEAAGDAIAVAGLLARLDSFMGFAHRGDFGAIRKAVGVRLDSGLAQPLELRPPLGEQVRRLAGWLLAHGAEPIAS